MPKRKGLPTIPDYEGLPRNQELMVVQKSNPLQTLAETSMTLPELKILDVYLSRIDSHEPDKRHVCLKKGELENLLGVTRMHREELEKRIDNLFQVVTIQDENKPKKFTKIALFEKAECEPDENGLWQVNLICTVSAMEYIFNVENIGYLRYRLKNVINLTSRYSYILYLYLENNRFRKSWKISIEDLREVLQCKAETYDVFKRFNDLILKKCHKEINEKTETKYTYKPIRTGRKVSAISFTVETLADVIPDLEDEQSQDKSDVYIDYGSPLGNLLGEAACKNEFSFEEIRVLQDLILQIMPAEDDLERCNYLVRLVHLMNYRDTIRSIHKRFSYLRTILENELKNMKEGF